MNGRLVMGTADVVAPGMVMRLAVRLADHARSRGMTLASIRRSKDRRSPSCYIALQDAMARLWIVRVSNHRRPHETSFPTPHFDLVTINDEAGFASACGTIDQMASGAMHWHDAETSVPMPRRRRAGR